MKDCIFCKIVKGEIPAAVIYENDRVVAFLDIAPINKGHALIVPKIHSENILEDDLDDLRLCLAAVKVLGPAIMKALGAEGFNLGINTHKAAGQAVFHTHFHLIPRFSGDGLNLWPQGKYKASEMDEVKSKIINQINL